MSLVMPTEQRRLGGISGTRARIGGRLGSALARGSRRFARIATAALGAAFDSTVGVALGTLDHALTRVEDGGAHLLVRATSAAGAALRRAPLPRPPAAVRRLGAFVAAHEDFQIGLVAAVISVVAYQWYVSQGLTLAYLNSISHMSIARRVWDARTPGLAQLGTVWPPLNHIAMLPLIWSDQLFPRRLRRHLPLDDRLRHRRH